MAIDCSIAAGRLRIDVISASIFRVRFTLDAEFGSKPSFMVLPQSAASAEWSLDQTDASALILRTSQVTLRVDRQSGAFTWFDAAGTLLVREPTGGGKKLERIPVEK